MIDYMGRVKVFMESADQVTPVTSGEELSKLREFRASLVCEEAIELSDALYKGDAIEIADGLADLLYVVFGTAIALDVPIESIFNEVHRSNMTKRFSDGTFHKDKNGKVIRSFEYEPPNLAPLLDHKENNNA